MQIEAPGLGLADVEGARHRLAQPLVADGLEALHGIGEVGLTRAEDAAMAQMDAAMAQAQAGGPSVADFQSFQQAANLGTTTMDHDGIDSHLLQKHHVARKGFSHGCVAHGMAAIFDDEGAPGEAPHIRQRLGDRLRRAQPFLGLADVFRRHGVGP